MHTKESEDQDRSISLFDLLGIIRKGWKTIISASLLGVLGAVVVTANLPDKYEASAVISVGQVDSSSIESANVAVERMKTPAFQLKVAESTGSKDWQTALKKSATATAMHLTVGTIKNSSGSGREPLIDLHVRADSPETAEKIARAAVSELVNRHEELAQPRLNILREDLAISKKRLLAATKDLETLNKLTGSPYNKDERFTQLAMMTGVRGQKESEIIRERQTINEIEASLIPPRTRPTQLLEPAFVGEKPVAPKTTPLLALGLAGGFLAGLIAVLLLAAWRRVRT